MELIQFGNTDLKVTRIGLGLAALGRPGYINIGHHTDLNQNYDVRAMENHAHAVLDIAYDYGIRYYDAARSYGKAELFLSSWIKDRHDVVIGSKWGYTYTADWKVEAEKHEVKEHSIAVLNRQVKESQAILDQNLNIYHIHSASMESGVLQNNQVIEKLWEMKEHGLIIGLSLSGPRQADTLAQSMEIRVQGECLFQSVQITWNLLENSSTQILEKASQAGYGIIIKEALANGRLTSRNDDASFKDKRDLLKNIAKKHRIGMDAISIAYALSQPWASIVLSGAATKKHLFSNLNALSVQLDKEDISLLDQMKEEPNDYWETRSKLAWN